MDLIEFKAQLTNALIDELYAREVEFSGYTMRAFDLGIHPWHGYIEISFLTTNDDCSDHEIGDWELYNFADTSTEKWPQAANLMKWMRVYYEADPKPRAHELFVIAAQILQSSEVQEALHRFNLDPNFQVSVYNPDDSAFRNFCV